MTQAAGIGVAWSGIKRFAFRAICAYVLLYNLPFPINLIPQFGFRAQTFITNIWRPIVLWVGERVFGVTITAFPGASGDTTYNYIQVMCMLIFAIAIASIWSLVDRWRTNYSRGFAALRAYVRFVLAVAMFGYGASKVIPAQFPPPTLDRLMQPFGDASPMGLLWTFMAYSKGYSIFTGAVEMIGGVLLIPRRTALLGALVTAASMLHIVALNFFFDVPVKLYSTHLLLMALLVAAPDLGRLIRFFVLNRAVEAPTVGRLVRWSWLHWTIVAARTAIAGYLVYIALYGGLMSYRMWRAPILLPELRGIWKVDEFAVDGQPIDANAPSRWRWMIFDVSNLFAIHYVDQPRERFRIVQPTWSGHATFTRWSDPKWRASFEFDQPSPDTLTVRADVEGKTVNARLTRKPTPDFLLTTRGFHWINEQPFNR